MAAPGITVGVDGSHASDAALVYALDEAVSRDMPVLAVTVWWLGPVLHELHDEISEERHAEAGRVQDSAIERALAEVDDPEVVSASITRLLVHGDPAEALVEAARDSNHLVVGSEHKHLLRRVTEGSVSARCVRNSAVPVTVVPWPPQTESERDSARRELRPERDERFGRAHPAPRRMAEIDA
jgi:nucleotide-binding universal stress UspA family protein